MNENSFMVGSDGTANARLAYVNADDDKYVPGETPDVTYNGRVTVDDMNPDTLPRPLKLVKHGPRYVQPDHPGIVGNRVRIYSPCTGIVVRDYDPATGITTKTVCEVARLFITSRDAYFPPHSPVDPFFERGVGDPVYFIAAGVDFRSIVTPYYGTVAYADESAIKRFLKRFGRDGMDNWEYDTGVPFPYRRFPGRTRRNRADDAPEQDD